MAMKVKVLLERQENADYFNVPINTTVEISFEHYVAAVVASEIGNSNLEACKAQAVAARTYALNYLQTHSYISDLSTKAQAYRANRVNVHNYPNAIAATFDTYGQIITYNNKPINAVYSSSNGRYTVSCKERWGNEVPYLIAREDPWDKAASSKRNGHGVGLSQKGTVYAAQQGINYKSILAFYYPHTTLKENYGEKAKLSKEVAEYMYDILKKKLEK